MAPKTETKTQRYRFILEKRDFHFCSSHFTILGEGVAESLHGHNFYVKAELCGSRLDSDDLLVDIAAFKKELRRLCSALDGQTLLQAESPQLRLSYDSDMVTIRLNEQIYHLPKKNVLALPLRNTSVESLARYIWLQMSPFVAGSGVDTMAIAVEETDGQSCWFEDVLMAEN